ncbi:MAG: hypothetical protein ABR502_08185 [Chitinophagaceae bacterium]
MQHSIHVFCLIAMKGNIYCFPIFVHHYRFYDDPRMCACCGYKWLVVQEAVDECIAL